MIITYIEPMDHKETVIYLIWNSSWINWKKCQIGISMANILACRHAHFAIGAFQSVDTQQQTTKQHFKVWNTNASRDWRFGIRYFGSLAKLNPPECLDSRATSWNLWQHCCTPIFWISINFCHIHSISCWEVFNLKFNYQQIPQTPR